MADYTPVQALGGGPFTSQASGTIVGGDAVVASGSGTVAASGAAGAAVGIAAHDAVTGQKVAVWPLKAVHETVAGVGGATFGQPLKVGATAGVLIPWVSGTDTVPTWVGTALTTATATNILRWVGR